jgi:hypothetical protein
MKFPDCVASGGRLISFVLVLSSLASADTILFQRALPQGPNVNAASANRSDVDRINPKDNSSNYFINGDDFTVTGSTWSISSIAVFIVMNKVGDAPSDEFTNFSLYLAPDTGDQQPQNFQVASTSATPTLVTFPGATSACSGAYLATDNVTCLPVYMMTFATNLTLSPGKYDFAADGTLKGGLTGCVGTCGWYNLAVAAAPTGGSTENGADGLYLNWFAGTPTPSLANLNQGYVTVNSKGSFQNGPCGTPTADVCGGFSASTDMNVVVTGNTIPEPGTVGLVMLGGLAFALTQIRRRFAPSRS